MWQCRHFWYFPDVQQHLVRTKKRTSVGIVLETENQEKYIILHTDWLWCMCDQPVSCT